MKTKNRLIFSQIKTSINQKIELTYMKAIGPIADVGENKFFAVRFANFKVFENHHTRLARERHANELSSTDNL